MTMDYTNVPAHLISPLSVDTNIDYSLDMTKFPGLNDPECMKQLALLPSVSPANTAVDLPRVCQLCGNLIPYKTDDSIQCGFCVYYGLSDSEKQEETTDELFSLIASCDISTVMENSHSSEDLQSVFEDIINSTSSHVSTTSISELVSSPLLQLSPLSPLPSPDLDFIFVKATSETNNAVNCEREVPSVNKLGVTFDEFYIDTTCVLEDLVDEDENMMFTPTEFDTSRRKRKHPGDSDNKLRKRRKSFDAIEDILMNCFGDFGHLNSVYSNDRNEVMTRFS